MKIRSIAPLLICLGCTTYETRYTDTAALFIRDSPSQTGSSLNLLPRGTAVLVSDTNVADNIEKRQGRWLRLKGDPTGFVFDAYLSERLNPGKGLLIIHKDNTDPLCYGTDFLHIFSSRLELANGEFRDLTKRSRYGGALDIKYTGHYIALNDGLVLSYTAGTGVETTLQTSKSRVVNEVLEKQVRLYWSDRARGFLTEDQVQLLAQPNMLIDRKTCRIQSRTAWIGENGCVENVGDYGRVTVSGYYCVPQK